MLEAGPSVPGVERGTCPPWPLLLFALRAGRLGFLSEPSLSKMAEYLSPRRP